MLTSSNGVPPIGSLHVCYPAKLSSAHSVFKNPAGSSYDSAVLSTSLKGEDAFQKKLVGQLSQEVRTSTTIGDVQAYRQAVRSGEYTPDPLAIAQKILFLV